jgi:hypothetical protein
MTLVHITYEPTVAYSYNIYPSSSPQTPELITILLPLRRTYVWQPPQGLTLIETF